jgi:hypothetical protein
MVRAKFRVNSYETCLQSSGNSEKPVECRTVKLTAVYDNSEENKKFFRYTPNGQITIGLLNPEAWQSFALGEEYYVDFTPAKKDE